MKPWIRYWNRLWDLAQDRENTQETPEPASGQERLPPATARRMLERASDNGSNSVRERAAWTLQSVLGNRGLSAPAVGEPLPTAARARLEAALGVDLSAIRIQRDEAATQALDARAFTCGDQIVVGRGDTVADSELLAHEVTHAVQARRRSARTGVSRPGDGSEREAERAARATRRGETASIDASSSPVPMIQRQARAVPATDISPVVRRETIRIMLMLQYREQGGSGPLALTPALQNELRRLLPQLGTAEIARLWTPPPAGPMQAFQRLIDAGHLPLVTAAPKAAELPVPRPEEKAAPERESSVTLGGMGMVGAHFRLNPRVPAPVIATIRKHLSGRGLPLSHRQVEAVLAGREQGVETIRAILVQAVPGLSADKGTELARTIADFLLDKSLQAQMERETPLAVERQEQQAEALLSAQGNVPELLEKIPIGASVTIYF